MTTTKVRFSMDRASSTNTIDSSNNTQGEETEETEESEGALNDQMRLLKKEKVERRSRRWEDGIFVRSVHAERFRRR